ncbi:MAG: ComEC/Rec2 family competence protein [Rickettsiales bacterium]|nr:ComEC/Rec2 family competence protein [Pseudomonadota bacterium]MDA0966577.1 ComEC/Rec2 family competence protein [Pseudomonadota bacterium]MDG4543606.1 ComEC/Rec2 family competence protein [Rickettsiales bacterium]MDG4545753.1 ComEC/Rec2 family competence protein [Rickettsiales bacterium]MDG4547474.1 ComEC/Rec2 family competence protein [Rickettsiales bacterium]
MSSQSKLQDIVIAEKDSYFLWIPVLFGIGVIAYFKIPFEPDIKISILLTALLLVGIFIYRKNTYLIWLLIISLIISCGFLSANLRTILVKAPVISKETGIKKITGTIESISSRTTGKRFVLTEIEIEGVAKENTPKKVRVNINKNDSGAVIGDRISILANLLPLPRPVIPGGYDFPRHAYYQQIGAIGYSVSDGEIIYSPKSLSFNASLENLRKSIKENILKSSDSKNGNIAVALLVGDKGGIDKKTLDEIRFSGIAHILAISGMHLSLVAAIFFFSGRFIFALSKKLALNYNIKKWAAFVAIIGSFIYLLISGTPISAQRAFIMTSLILTAIIIDRLATPMRSVAVAALIILILTPESILTPSFQMSFAAVFALISLYEIAKPFFKYYSEFGIFKKIGIYLFGIIFSSAVAGIATAPFAMYHFNNFAPYGILTNLIVVPLTSLFVMPFGVLTLLLMPFGLEQIGLIPMIFGIDIIVKTASYISSLPQPVGNIGQMSDITLAMLTVGGVIFLFLKTKIRYAGILVMISGTLFSLSPNIPNIIIGEDTKLIAVKTSPDNLAFSSKFHERYSREQWQKRYAIENPITFAQTEGDIIKCDSTRCHYKYENTLASFIKHPIAFEEDCENADIIINLTYIKKRCKNKKLIINKQDIRKQGANVIQYGDGTFEVYNVSSLNKGRAWQND